MRKSAPAPRWCSFTPRSLFPAPAWFRRSSANFRRFWRAMALRILPKPSARIRRNCPSNGQSAVALGIKDRAICRDAAREHGLGNCTLFATLCLWGVGVIAVQANWGDVWKLGLSVFAHQDIEVQILIGLAVAFGAVMILEGLRANFFPRRRGAAIRQAARPEEPVMMAGLPEAPPAPQAMAPATAAASSFTAFRAAAQPHSLKRKTSSIRRHKAARPAIRHMANGPEIPQA